MATPRTSSGLGAARVGAIPAGTSTAIDAIELLEGDHRQVEGWFTQFDRAQSLAHKQDLANRICKALRIHMRIEEEILYPAFLEAVGDRSLYDDAEAAHVQARELIADVETCDAGDDTNFDFQVKSLARLIERHVTDEEQPGGLFDEVSQSTLDLYELGARLEHRKIELMEDSTTDRGYDAAVRGEPDEDGDGAS